MRANILDVNKTCRNCGLTLAVSEFHINKAKQDGLEIYCKSCVKIKKKANASKPKYKLTRQAQSRRYREKVKVIKPEVLLYASAKKRAKRDKLPFTITVQDILIPEYCPVLGIKLQSAEKFVADCSPSLDKIQPHLGYIQGNIQVISHLANKMKNSATYAELIKFADWIQANIR